MKIRKQQLLILGLFLVSMLGWLSSLIAFPMENWERLSEKQEEKGRTLTSNKKMNIPATPNISGSVLRSNNAFTQEQPIIKEGDIPQESFATADYHDHMIAWLKTNNRDIVSRLGKMHRSENFCFGLTADEEITNQKIQNIKRALYNGRGISSDRSQLTKQLGELRNHFSPTSIERDEVNDIIGRITIFDKILLQLEKKAYEKLANFEGVNHELEQAFQPDKYHPFKKLGQNITFCNFEYAAVQATKDFFVSIDSDKVEEAITAHDLDEEGKKKIRAAILREYVENLSSQLQESDSVLEAIIKKELTCANQADWTLSGSLPNQLVSDYNNNLRQFQERFCKQRNGENNQSSNYFLKGEGRDYLDEKENADNKKRFFKEQLCQLGDDLKRNFSTESLSVDETKFREALDLLNTISERYHNSSTEEIKFFFGVKNESNATYNGIKNLFSFLKDINDKMDKEWHEKSQVVTHQGEL